MEASLYELKKEEVKEEQKVYPKQPEQLPPVDLLEEPEPVVQNVTPQK